MSVLTRILIVAVLLLLAGTALLVGVVGMLDPVGSKMSDDGAPFGPPHPWWYGLFSFALSAGSFWLAVVLLRPLVMQTGSRESKSDNT